MPPAVSGATGPERLHALAAALTTRRLAVIVLFVGLFATAVSVHVNAGTFAHLSAGAWMLGHGRVLDHDAFSHTMAGTPWIDASWLSDVATALVYRMAGYAGLNLVTSLLIWVTFVVIFRSGRADTYVRALAVALAAGAMAISWSAGPQVVTLLFAALFNLVLIRHRETTDGRLWLLPPLMIAWVNLDAGFTIGLLLVGTTFAGELLTATVDRLRPVPSRHGPRSFSGPLRIGAAGLACLLATGLNPHGFALLQATVGTGAAEALRGLDRLSGPDFHERAAQFFIVLWLLVLAVAGMSRRRLRLTDLLLVSVFSVVALRAADRIAVFAVVAAPILMWHGGALVSEFEDYALRHGLVRPRPRATLALNWILLCLVAVGAAIKVQWPLSPGATELSMARTFPVGAVTYLRTHHVRGALFNATAFGGFLSWYVHPAHPVFMDERPRLYDAETRRDYDRAYLARPGYEGTLAKHRVGAVLVEPGAPIAQALERDAGWALVYRDWLSVILVRRPEAGPQ